MATRLPEWVTVGLVRAVEAAAIASARTMGFGDRHRSDEVAVAAMRDALQEMPVRGRVVIGEGERDKAPMLWSGETFGSGDANALEIEIAVDPLEGTNLCATGGPGAIAVLAASGRGGLLQAPDIYMEKVVVGPAAAPLLGERIHLDQPADEMVAAIAEAEGLAPADLGIAVLDRPRHAEIIAGVRRAGARVLLIGDGDLSAGIRTALPGSGIHAAIGSGGAPEGVITAAALRCLGGGMLGRLLVRNHEERGRVERVGVPDPQAERSADDLAPGPHLVVCAAGVTDGALVEGVQSGAAGIRTTTLILENDPPEISRLTRTRRG